MRMSLACLAGILLLGGCGGPSAPASSPEASGPGYGGARGADLSIEAITPAAEPIRVGQAGDDPADIARYILASGAYGSVSPDGRMVAMSWRISGEAQLWVMPAEGGQPRQLTFGNGVTFFAWTPDSGALLYGADNNGNEQPSFNRISVDGLTGTELLAAKPGAFRVFGDFLPDGRSFLFTSPERNGSDFDIYLAGTSGPPELIAEGNLGVSVQAVSPDGRMAIVTEGVGEDSDKLMLLDIAARRLTTLSDPDPRASHASGGFAWAPDSSGFYFATNDGREFAALAFYDIGAGSTSIIHEAASDIETVSLCGPKGRWLAWTTNEDGFYRLHIEDRTSRRPVASPVLPEGVLDLNCSLASSRMAISVTSWNTPGDILVLDLATGQARTAFAGSLAGLDARRLVKPVSLRMKARDGVELQGLLYLPDASSLKGASKPPVLFQVHGGPTAQSIASFDSIAQYCVDRGIAVFKPNVRGSTGFGRTYVTLDDQKKRLDSVRDLVDMLAFLGTDGRVDASRAAVSGGSYGGYMVNAVVGAYPDAFDAGVSLYGIGNWVTGLEVASPGLKASDRIEYGDIADPEWRRFYTEISPVNNADRIRAPMLYAHGMMDPRIDISETETMVKALRGNGVATTFIRFPDEGHGWRKLSNRLFYYRREAEFLEAHLLSPG